MKLNLLCGINQLGYGISGLNITLALMNAGIDVALFPIGQLEVPEYAKEVINKARHQSGYYNPTCPSLKIWHQDQLAEHVGKYLHIGFPFFELDTFTPREKAHLINQDRVFVASHWAKGILEASLGDLDVRVVPLGVDRGIFHEGVLDDHRLMPDFTIFCNVGKWEVRKGHDFLLGAFNKAFKATDKVALIMACYNPFIGDQNSYWAKRYKNSPLGRQINLLPRLTDQAGLTRIMMSSDCGVFPSRAEGWNLELLEFMSMGKTVITTNVSAHTEFANHENARLIQAGEVEPAYDNVWFHGQGNWAKLGQSEEEQLIMHLREVHSLKQTGALKRNTAGISTAKQFSWANTAQHILTGIGGYNVG